jgi:hypothetical protein
MMDSLRRIWIIFGKDWRDALRDARVLFAIVTPIGIGVLYNIIVIDETPRPSATVVIVGESDTAFGERLHGMVDSAIELTIRTPDDRSLETIVGSGDADVGFALPERFDAAVAAGEQPAIDVVVGEDPSVGGNYVLAALDPTLRDMAGQAPPAEVRLAVAETVTIEQSQFERVGPRRYFVLASAVMVVTMIGMMAVPIVLLEETEKKTIDALALIASYREIVLAKALLGLVYAAIAISLLVAITRMIPDRWPVFVGAVAGLALAVIGIGLLLAGIFRSAGQLNTWAGLIMLPLVAPAFIVGIGLSSRADTLAGLLPTGAGMRLMLDSQERSLESSQVAASFTVMAVWALVAYVLVTVQISRKRN